MLRADGKIQSVCVYVSKESKDTETLMKIVGASVCHVPFFSSKGNAANTNVSL